MLAMINRGRIQDPATVEEFENLMARLRGFLSQSFDEDGELIVADPNLAVTPVGGTIQYAGTTAPAGWVMCDGAQVSRTTYKSLFDVVGTTYGAGDGSTTFNVPDLRQRFPLGKAASGTGATLGATGGAIDHTHTSGAHTHTIASQPAHDHTTPAHAHAISSEAAHAHTVDSHAHGIVIIAGSVHGPVVDQNLDGATIRATPSSTGSSEDNSTAAASPGTSSNGSHDHGGATSSGGSGTTGSDGAHDHGGVTGSSSGTTGTENPPYLVMNFIVFAGV